MPRYNLFKTFINVGFTTIFCCKLKQNYINKQEEIEKIKKIKRIEKIKRIKMSGLQQA